MDDRIPEFDSPLYCRTVNGIGRVVDPSDEIIIVKYVWDGDGFTLDSSHGIKANDLKRIERAIHENSDIILNRWYEVFGDTENDEDNE